MTARAEIIDVESTIQHEIDSGASRRDIAQTYALALRSSWPTDWWAVNRMILDRWSMSGLQWIKAQASSGACFGGRDSSVDAEETDKELN